MVALHAWVTFASYAAFFAAVVTGIAFLVQERRLKRKDPGLLAAASAPLELLERINRWAVIIGFCLFSVGMVHAFFLARSSWGAFWSWDPKETSSVATWGAYALVLWLRLTVGLRGRRVVLMSVMSFLLVMFTFVGVNYFLGGRHVFF